MRRHRHDFQPSYVNAAGFRSAAAGFETSSYSSRFAWAYCASSRKIAQGWEIVGRKREDEVGTCGNNRIDDNL